MQENISFLVAFLAGAASFFSPCILPLVPSYISYITGISFEDLTASNKQTRLAVAKHSILFIIGFSIIFISFGIITAYFGSSLMLYRSAIRKAGAVIIILFGLHLTGALRIKALEKEKRLQLKSKPLGYLGSVFTGMVFAAGWAPCVGPILSSILFYAVTEKIYTAVLLLSFYSLGLGLPLFIVGVAFDNFILVFNKIKNFTKYVSVISGILLIIVGILLFTNYFRVLEDLLMAMFEVRR